MRFTGVSDRGRRRRANEDAYVCEPPLFAIADGMGGAQAGEVASKLAAAVLQEPDPEETAATQGEERLASLIQEANRRVFQRSNEDAATSGMGTTMTVALVDSATGRIAFGHVGDSRAYRVRGGELEQLTDDHSLVGELVRSGRLSVEEAEAHPQRSVITRALGTEPDVDVDTFTVDAEPDDVYLLCSDGLTDMVSAREILPLVESADDLEDAARALVNAANAGGGEDNITVVLFQLDSTPAADGAGDADETVRMPAAAAPGPELEDDEDTLSPLDAVPAVDTAVIPAAAVEEHLQQAQPAAAAAQPKRRVLPLVILILLLLTLLLLAVWGLSR